jgi:hypothetical protein
MSMNPWRLLRDGCDYLLGNRIDDTDIAVALIHNQQRLRANANNRQQKRKTWQQAPKNRFSHGV